MLAGSCEVAVAAQADAARASWEIITPLDRPVVPPVYSSAARAAGSLSISPAGAAASRSASDRNSSFPGTSSPATSSPATSASGTSSSGTAGATTMARSPSTPAAAAVTLGRNSGVVMASTAPLSLSTCRSSSSLSRNSTGVATAPARQTAW